MRILRISLENIASLVGRHTIDFTREPVRSAGIFSISGPTGSGKSTLLDALCVALYERTPRLAAARGTEKLADLSQNDPRNLLSRGRAQGSAEVAFIGVDGNEYTARWRVRRSRNKVDGLFQGTEITLYRGNVAPGVEGTQEQGGKKSEVLPAIRAKVGLSFEQFTRAVLLAQNEFATFLKANDTDRAEILQALTGTERFERISIAVFARCGLARKAVDEVLAQLAGNAPMAPEARAEAESVSATAESEYKLAGEKVVERKRHAEWFAQLRSLTTDLEKAGALLAAAIAARDAAAPRGTELAHTEVASREARGLRDAALRTERELEAARKHCVDADAALRTATEQARVQKDLHEAAVVAVTAADKALADARPMLLAARALDAKLGPLAENAARSATDLATAERQLKASTDSHDALHRERLKASDENVVIRNRLADLRAIAAFAPDAGAWLERLERAIGTRNAALAVEREHGLATKAEEAKTKAIESERGREQTVRTRATAAAERLDAAALELRKYDAEKIAGERMAATAARDALVALGHHLEHTRGLAQQAAVVSGELSALRAKDETDALVRVQIAQTGIPTAEAALHEARNAHRLAEAAMTDAALKLRESIVEGEPCPVCGATDHPFAAEPPNHESAALRALRDNAVEKEKTVNALRAQAAGLEAAARERALQMEEKARLAAKLATEQEAARSLQITHPAAIAIAALPEAERTEAAGIGAAAESDKLKQADQMDAARRSAEKTREQCQTERDKAARELTQLEARLAEFGTDLATLRTRRESIEAARTTAAADFTVARGAIAPLLASRPNAASEWERDPVTYRDSFATETSAYLALEKQSAGLVAFIRERDAALSQLKESIAGATAERTAKLAAATTAREAHETVQRERVALFGGRAADVVEAELAGSIVRTNKARDERSDARNLGDKQVATATEGQRLANLAVGEKASQRTTAAQQLDTWLAEFSSRTGRVLDAAGLDALLARDDAWIQTERAALDALERAIGSAEGGVKARQETLTAHQSTRPTTDEEAVVAANLVELSTAQDAAEQRRDAARTALLADDRRRADCAALNNELEARQLAARPWERLNALIGSADGAKFRGIAQRRSLDILIGYGNAQLEQLNGRYRLKRLEQSLNLIMIDRDMGDEHRSVHSLSGGESFLVSLALALALASLTSNRLRIESLFIDEGFGSLDPETLNTAMGALMRLEAQGRKVGVISHVTEMADAVPVQIQVVKGRSGTARLVIPGVADVPAIEEPVVESDVAGIAAQILTILQREQAAGNGKVSTRALRGEVGCGAGEFTKAREVLGGKVVTEGKSLLLAAQSGDQK